MASNGEDEVEEVEEEEDSIQSRLDTEIELLRAMYPDQIKYDSASRELTYSQNVDVESRSRGGGTGRRVDGSCAVTLHIPRAYPGAELPKVIMACDAQGNSLTAAFGAVMEAQAPAEGVEALDEIVAAFNEYIEIAREQNKDADAGADGQGEEDEETKGEETPDSNAQDTVAALTASNEANSTATATAPPKKTVIIWLHHLLSTTKRKHALTLAPTTLSGLSKPGYPGVLLFSGPAAAVDEHVAGLKALKWQAFQVRLEEDGEWAFGHGSGVREVGSVREVVGGVVGEERRVLVMAALRMRAR